MRQIGVAHQRADPHAAVGKLLDAVEPGQAGDVDQAARAGDAALHQVQQVGAAGEIGGAGLGSGGDGLGDRRGPDVIEACSCRFLPVVLGKLLSAPPAPPR